jgi:Helix-turn-helix domain
MSEKFNAVLWANWEQRFLEEEEQAYREQEPEEPTELVPKHDRMTSKEVMNELRWSMSTLRRRVSSRKLAYYKEDGKMFFRRADVERYKQKRYVREK